MDLWKDWAQNAAFPLESPLRLNRGRESLAELERFAGEA